MTKYITVRLPECYHCEMDKLIEKYGFTSRADVVKSALREFFQKYPETKIVLENGRFVNSNSDDYKPVSTDT
ncbi:ribbon-helix-helix domain-containing protein [Candidatus Bathycorpusculum sp.]|uniref:ribbon-helix-helix domain-containing protein n=1 Tax=Candidatus Bathycorpusculum sp. TaxID=2994959 RepID=UPI00282D2BD5|nr:ribbon-helix-helix domain-containing protein [Candidatus Termitimicrobium sp.]MCL2686839.1 ribbon-helix-helix domain-containing protein [Candidatus Termitimicrobium sp.]